MAAKRPLCMYEGIPKELAASDSLVSTSMWEIDGDGDYIPASTIRTDPLWTTDADGDVIPL